MRVREKERKKERECVRRMASALSVTFRALGGVKGNGAPCYLLRVDDFTFLLDCGMLDADEHGLGESGRGAQSGKSKRSRLDADLAAVAGEVDAVLLSHCDTRHLGNIPRLVGRLGLPARVPIYATAPVHKMGQMFLYDYLLSRTEYDEHFDAFSLDDVDAAFGRFVLLKYSQRVALSGRGAGITITALPAGHLIGGTIWRISKEGEEIVYAVNYNHRRDRHLNASALEAFSRPAVLITDAFSAMRAPPSNRRGRDTAFVDFIVGKLRQSGNVLLPVDTAGRVLEILLVLDQHWTQNRLGAYPIVLVTNVAHNTLEFARSQLEWMSDSVSKAFEQARDNAFTCRYVHLCHSLAEVDSLPPGPKVVLSSMPTLDFGPARELFSRWAPDSRNAIVFTSRARDGSLAWRVQSRGERRIDLRVSRKVPLEGAELEEYLAKKAAEEEANGAITYGEAEEEEADGGGDATAKKKREHQEGEEDEKPEAGGNDGDDREEKDDMDVDNDGEAAVVEKEVAWSKYRARDASIVFVDGFEPPADAVVPMFSDPPPYANWDEYGVLGDPMEFVGSKVDKRDLPAGGFNADADGVEEPGAVEVPSRAAVEVPTKLVSRNLTVSVACTIEYMDYEGLSDGRSIRNIITSVGPYSLILVDGSTDATENIRKYCLNANVIAGDKLYAPSLGETVDASSDIVSYKVNLSDELLNSLTISSLGEYEVAWVEAQVQEGKPPLLTKPDDAMVMSSGLSALYIGDPKLSDFRQLLQSRGIKAEFAEGALVCGAHGVVVVKRAGDNLTLEGGICDDYYAVRKLLYSQYHALLR